MSCLEEITDALFKNNSKLADYQDIESKIAVSLLMSRLTETDSKELVRLLARRFRVKQSVIRQLLDLTEFNRRKSMPVEALATAIKTQYSPRKLKCLIRDLWDIAIVDDELHTLEETMIYHVADRLGLKRRDVIDQQTRVCN